MKKEELLALCGAENTAEISLLSKIYENINDISGLNEIYKKLANISKINDAEEICGMIRISECNLLKYPLEELNLEYIQDMCEYLVLCGRNKVLLNEKLNVLKQRLNNIEQLNDSDEIVTLSQDVRSLLKKSTLESLNAAEMLVILNQRMLIQENESKPLLSQYNEEREKQIISTKVPVANKANSKCGISCTIQ